MHAMHSEKKKASLAQAKMGTKGVMGKAMMAAAKAEQEKEPTKTSVLRAASSLGKDDKETLSNSVKNGDWEVAKGVIEGGLNPNTKLDEEGRTALMLAVEYSDATMTDTLFDLGASVDVQDSDGRNAFDYCMGQGGETKQHHDTVASAEEVARYVRTEILPLVESALYACARTRPQDKSPCHFVAEYLLEHHSAYKPAPNMMLPWHEMMQEEEEEVSKPLGVSSTEMMIALEMFKKYDVDKNLELEIEQLTLVVLRMGERIAGRPVPDTTVLRAVKTVMSEVALKSADSVVTKEDLVGCLDRICPVFRSFDSPLNEASFEEKPAEKPSADVVEELYDQFDLNEDHILMPDELFLLLRRACDHSGFAISDVECMELFRLLMEHAMMDKNDDELLDKEEVKDAFDLIFRFYKQKSAVNWEYETYDLEPKAAPEPEPEPAAEVFVEEFVEEVEAVVEPAAEPAPEPEPAAETVVEEAVESVTFEQIGKENLMKAFDDVDEDEAGIAPRLDLRKQVDTFVPRCADVQNLSDDVRALDAMIIEREEYEEVVDAWLAREGGPKA